MQRCSSENNTVLYNAAGDHNSAVASMNFSDGLQRQVSEDDGVGPSRMQQQLDAVEFKNEPCDVWGLEAPGDRIYELDGDMRTDIKNLRHLRLIREALQYWQSYDGFARVSMSIGTTNLVTSLGYYVLSYVLISNHAVIAAWLTVLIFMSIVAALIRLDLSLTSFEYKTTVAFAISGPAATAFAAQQWYQKTNTSAAVVGTVMPLVYCTHGLFLLILLYICKVSEQRGGAMLPTGFRSVMYIDVFGWIHDVAGMSRPALVQEETRTQALPTDLLERNDPPSYQAVGYVHGQPVPTRPEQLPGAAVPPVPAEALRKEEFLATTFIPRDRAQDNEGEDPLESGAIRPGAAPWRIFCCATMLLVCLWWGSGMLVLMRLGGWKGANVRPLLKEDEAMMEAFPEFLQITPELKGGKLIQTSWPHEHIRPHSLACSQVAEDDEHADHGIVSAITEFEMFIGRFKEGGPQLSHVDFERKFPCTGLEGEPLQGVALDCSSRARGCRTLLLHSQGQKLSTCPVPGQKDGTEMLSTTQEHTVTSKIGSWLADAHDEYSEDGGMPEHILSLALAPNCLEGVSNCAYVQTSAHRLVEVAHEGTHADEASYFPIHAFGQAPQDRVLQSASLHMIGDRYLGMLVAGGKHLHVVDPQDGSPIAQFLMPSPSKGQTWAAMCSAGADFFALTQGPSPQLWRFPVPIELRSMDGPSSQLPSRSRALRGGATVQLIPQN